MITKRVAVYARVSKDSQETENQLIELREHATRRGWNATEFIDHGEKGWKDSRPALDRMMAEVRRRRFDVVFVWKFDRFARTVRHLVTTLEELNALGVDFVSFIEGIDTTTPLGKMVFTVIAAVAELETSNIRDRVMAGLKRARAQGKVIGRPRKTLDLDRARELKAQGLGIRAIAAKIGARPSTLARALAVSKPPSQAAA